MKTIHGLHLCWGTYGFWLPNDPRGSGSQHVWFEPLREFGDATSVEDRSRSMARKPHDRRQRLAAKNVLPRPAVQFTGVQARAVGRGFAEWVKEVELPVWACAILPDHVHLVVGPSEISAEAVVNRLKAFGTRHLKQESLHPFGHLMRPSGSVPKCWQRGGWKVYLFDEVAVRREIKYVEDNPLKEGKAHQRWSFVVPYTA